MCTCFFRLRSIDGIIIPGGFGSRGIEGMVLACKYARENNVPYPVSYTHLEELYTQGKKLGYPDSTIARLSGCKVEFERKPTFKMVDTCAGEFAAHTPYFYATYDTEEAGGEDEALEFIGEDREMCIRDSFQTARGRFCVFLNKFP